MKFNEWTLGLAAIGVISLASAAQAEEAQHQVMTALSSTTISGYVNTSAIWHLGKGNMALPGRSFDGPAKQDGFNLDVVKLQLEKPLDEGQWSAGYQVGLLFGPDANTYNTTSTGFFANTSDFGIKDANVTLRAPVGNGLDFKMGYWESPIGYEVFDAGSNPNYSRSYGYFIEPKQFTGILASYRISEMVSLSGGVANAGVDGFTAASNTINARSAKYETLKTYMGSITFTAPESAGAMKGASLYAGVIDTAHATAPNVFNYYVGLSLPTPVEGFSLGAAWDYRSNSGANGITSAHAWAASVYLTYQASEKLKISNRAEYASGSNGSWYFSPIGAKSNHNELLGETLTIDYSLWANVITRVEGRWDHELGGKGIFNDGTDKNSISVALNVIYKF